MGRGRCGLGLGRHEEDLQKGIQGACRGLPKQLLSMCRLLTCKPDDLEGVARMVEDEVVYRIRREYGERRAEFVVEAGIAGTFSDDQKVTLPALAKAYGLSDKQKERLRKRLEVWRKANIDGGWIERTERKPREPKYLYPFGKIKSIVIEVLSSG